MKLDSYISYSSQVGDILICIILKSGEKSKMKTNSFDGAHLYYSSHVEFSDKLWRPLNPGLSHLQFHSPLSDLLQFRVFKQFDKERKEILGCLQDLQSELMILEVKLSKFPSSKSVFSLLGSEGVATQISSDKAWSITSANNQKGSYERRKSVGSRVKLMDSAQVIPSSTAATASKSVHDLEGDLETLDLEEEAAIQRQQYRSGTPYHAFQNEEVESNVTPYSKEDYSFVEKRVQDENPGFMSMLTQRRRRVPNFISLRAKVIYSLIQCA